MGEVYVAEDTRLGRRVALKLLPPQMAENPERRQRFEREARAIAALQHPNIVTLFSVEESDGVAFLVMELVEGRPLGDVIEDHGLSLERLLDLAIPIADALAFAHGKQITHRDLKPDNILVGDDGRVKILDFGLAKLVASDVTGASGMSGRASPGSSDSTPAEAETVLADSGMTEEGRILGTVAYMSPEQAQGKPVDHRSDIFSFGVLLYEMATGQRPFQGDTSISTITSILRDDPPPVAEVNRSLPRALGQLIEGCLIKDPGRRTQSANELCDALERLNVELTTARTLASHSSYGLLVPPRRRSRGIALAFIGAAVAVFLIGLVPIVNKLLSPEQVAGIGSSGRPSVAVISFEDHSGSEEIRWLATGLPSMLLTGLAQTPGLDVVSSQRIHEILKEIGEEQLETIDKAVVSEVARRAGAGAIVAGSIYKSGPDIRIDVQVEDVRTGRLLFAREVTGRDVFPLVDRLTADIRSGLDVPAPPDIPNVAQVTSESLEAYRFYAEGLQAVNNHRYADGRRLMLAALEIDSTFAMAYSSLEAISRRIGEVDAADDYERQALAHLDRLPERQKLLVQAGEALRADDDVDRAIRILEELVSRFPDEEQGYAMLYGIHLGALFDRGQAMAIGERAVQAIPASGPLRNMYAYTLLWQGRYAEALRELEEYQRLRPDEPNPLDSLAEAYLYTGQPEKALEKYAGALELNPTFSNSHAGRAFAYAMLGRFGEALGELDREAEVLVESDLPLTFNLYVKAFLLSRVGRHREAEDRIRDGMALATELGDTSSEVAFHLLRARMASERGDLGEVRESVEHARAIIPQNKREIVRRIQMHAANAILGVVEARSGQSAEARARLETASEMGELPAAVSWTRSWLEGEVALAGGDIEGAMAAYAAGEPQLKSWFSVATPILTLVVNNSQLRTLEARAMIAAGDLAGAVEIYRGLNTPDIGAKWAAVMEPRFVLESARLLHRLGDFEGARHEYGQFLEYWKDADRGAPELEEAKAYLAGVAG
jgi:serine/threonine protein kinase/tetratricopeptide (TPR) repeat protein